MGTNVPAREIVATVLAEGANFVGLSALLDTTMRYMRETIVELESQELRGKVKVLIGGAPTSSEFAAEIGADAHCKDAFAAVAAAESFAKGGKQVKESNAAYQVAVSTGLYAKPQGIKGKYDHVRRYWKDEVTRFFLRPYLTQLRKRRQQKGIRILDLGCGSGDGFELLTGSRDPSVPVADTSNEVLPSHKVAFYKGIDLNEELLEQGRSVFQGWRQVDFAQGDFSQGLPLASGEPGYDIYFTSYGTMSHCRDREAVQLLSEIALHATPGAIIIADWLGAYFFEWQDLWASPLEEDYAMDYYVSYLYDNPREAARHLPSIWLRLMDQPTLLRIVERANERAGGEARFTRNF